MLNIKRNGNFLEILIPEFWREKNVETVLQTELLTPKKLLHHWRMGKKVLLNHEIVQWNQVIHSGVLSIPIFEPEINDIPPFSRNIKVIYEDDDILIVNKPFGINTHSDSPDQIETLLNMVSSYFISREILSKPRTVHRLDHDTSGLVLIAKNAFICSHLDRFLQDRKIRRSYQALVHGLVSQEKGTIETFVGRDRHQSKMRVSRQGQHAITHYQVLKYFPKENRTLVKCELETGRTHQIRIHMQHIGHPLIGDQLYGNTSRNKTDCRLALHAFQLELTHPLSGKITCVQSDVPFQSGLI